MDAWTFWKDSRADACVRENELAKRPSGRNPSHHRRLLWTFSWTFHISRAKTSTETSTDWDV
jgi:hypothetical protein